MWGRGPALCKQNYLKKKIAKTCTSTNLELSEAVEAVHPVLLESLNLFRSLGQNLQRKEKLMKRLDKKTQIPIRGVRF